jgi:hypothetical protein
VRSRRHSLIYRSKIVVCDFSSQNPNVFYEASVAHILGKHVIPIAQNANDVPFELRYHRYVRISIVATVLRR